MGLDPFIGEITMFAGNFPPRNWAFCNGQLLQIATNTALFSLLGTTYGGDGRVTFGLPDLRGRVPMHWGSGPGLTPRTIGQKSGSETETLTTSQIPSHNHNVSPRCSNGLGDEVLPEGKYVAKPAGADTGEAFTGTPDKDMGATTSSNTGSGQSHNNMQPYQAISFIIALQGIFPSRS